jgi:hypothetical protein
LNRQDAKIAKERPGTFSGMLKNPLSPRLLKKAQMQGGARCAE